ncbi:MAG TPA: ATP-binding protein [Roseiflexaceae bacterium]|nr:ATP-binding protein [Roseiflexaceae bacterium]
MHKLQQAIRSHISYKIILPYLALTLLVTMVGAAVSLGLAAASWEDRLMMLLTQMGRDTSDAVVQRERDHLEFLRLAAGGQANPLNENALSMPDAFASGRPDEVAKALGPFYDFQRENDNLNLDRMIAFGTDGRALIDWLSVSEEPGADPERLENTDLSGVPDVQRVLAGAVVDGSDKFSNLIRFGNDLQPYFYTVVPVRQGERVVGGLLVAIKTDRMLQDIQRSSQAVLTTLYDPQGEPTSSTLRRDQIGEVQPMSEGTLEQLRRGAQSVFDRSTFQGRDVELAYSPLLIAGLPVGFFAVALWRDAEFSWLLINRNGILAIAIALAVGAVLLGFWIARRITTPLAALVETAEAVTAGDLDRRSPVTSADEIGRLALAFNQMTEHLLRLYHISRDLNAQIDVVEVLSTTSRALQPLLPGLHVLALLDGRTAWRYVLADDVPEQLRPLASLRLEPGDTRLVRLLEQRGPWTPPPDDEPTRRTLGVEGCSESAGLLLVPLIIRDNPIGLLVFGHPDPDAFSGTVEPTLLAVANMAASVLCNAALFTRVHHEASERQAILESLADGVVVCDPQGAILLLNPAAERLLDMPDWRERRRFFGEVRLEPASVGQEMFAEGQARLEHYRLGPHTVGLSRAPVQQSGGAPLGEVIVLHDISAEAAVDRAKTHFIETISHELRTPLTVITGYTELLLRGMIGELNDEQRDLLGHVRGRAEQINSIVKNVILVASIEAGTMGTDLEPLDVAEIIEEVTGQLRGAFAGKGLELRVDVPPALPRVLADREQLRVVLLQLLDNARRYTERGGATVSARRNGDTIEIDVCDSGPGIDPQDLAGLFTRFYRVEGNSSPERGSGLGLAITRQLMEQQGGRVWASSTVGQGSHFSIALPIAHGNNHTFTTNDRQTAAARPA